MSDDLFSRPSDLPQGNGLKIVDLEGDLVIVRPSEGEETDVVSEFGPTTMRESKVLVITGPLASNEWQELALFGAKLKYQATQALKTGKPIVGVVGKGEASPGKSAPWEFADPTDAQLERARKAFLAVHVPF